MKQRTSLPLLTSKERQYSNTPSGQQRSKLRSSSIIHQTSLSSSCSNHVGPPRLPLKKIKSEPWQRVSDRENRQESIMKKNNDSVINEEFLSSFNESSVFDKNFQRSFLSPPIQTHIDQLYEQIDDLTLQLSEERLNHKQTQMKSEETLFGKLQDQNKQFQELLRCKILDQKKELEEEKEKYLKLLSEGQTQNHKREEQLRKDLEFVKKSFHIYKISLDKENAEILQIKINKSAATMRNEGMNREINDAITKERKNMNTRQKIEIENLRKQHQEEINTIRKTFGDAESLSEELMLTKLELDDTKQRATNIATQLKDLEIQHMEATRELNDLRIRFDAKTKEIDQSYSSNAQLSIF